MDTKPTLVPSFEANTNIYANTEGQFSSNGLYENPLQSKVPPPFDPMIPETYPVAVGEFGHYVSQNHFNTNSGFKEQYKVCVKLSVS